MSALVQAILLAPGPDLDAAGLVKAAAEASIVKTRRLTDAPEHPRESHFRVLWLV